MSARNRSIAVFGILVAMSFAALLAHQAVAEEPAAVGNEGGVQWVSIPEILRVSGWPMYVLIFASFVAVAFVIYFLIVLREEQVVPRSLREELAARIDSGSLDEVRAVCQNKLSPLSAVALAAVDYLQTVPDAEAGLLADTVQGEGIRQAETIQGQTRYLMDIAAITPMIGLLGTVLGMVKAFRAVAVDEAMARPLVLADGVRQALYTTAAGLMIAIPAMVFYTIFREKANRLISRLEAASAELLASLQRKR